MRVYSHVCVSVNISLEPRWRVLHRRLPACADVVVVLVGASGARQKCVRTTARHLKRRYLRNLRAPAFSALQRASASTHFGFGSEQFKRICAFQQNSKNTSCYMFGMHELRDASQLILIVGSSVWLCTQLRILWYSARNLMEYDADVTLDGQCFTLDYWEIILQTRVLLPCCSSIDSSCCRHADTMSSSSVIRANGRSAPILPTLYVLPETVVREAKTDRLQWVRV